MLVSVFVLFILLLLQVNGVSYSPADEGTVMFGMSVTLNGSFNHVGSELERGVLAAFETINRLGGIWGGKMLNVTVLDDNYDPVISVDNTETFVDDSEIFALLGYMGSETVESVAPYATSEQIPLIGTFSGSSILRTNSDRVFVNLRASYDDELSAIVHYVVRKNQKFEISILYSNDSLGISCYNSLLRSLDAYDIDTSSEVIFEPQNFNVSGSVDQIFKGQPEVVILIGDPLNLVLSLVEFSYGKYKDEFSSLLFFTVSSVGTVHFAEYLSNYEIPLSYDNILVTQVVPNPFSVEEEYYEEEEEEEGGDDADEDEDNDDDDYSDLISSYENSLNLLYGDRDGNKSFVSFEGYIAAMLTAEILTKISGNSITREGFLDTIYNKEQTFFINRFEIGPYEENECNQGIRKVWVISISEDVDDPSLYQFKSIKNAEFIWRDSCISEPSLSREDLVFKHSIPLSGPLAGYGPPLIEGVRCAFREYNLNLPSYEDRMIHLVTVDDGYDKLTCENNTKMFLSEDNTFSFILYFGSPTTLQIKPLLMSEENTHISFIGPYTGAPHLRMSNMDSWINIRAGYEEEVWALTQVYLNEGYTKFACYYQNDAFGLSGYNALVTFLGYADLEIVAVVPYPTGTECTDEQFDEVMSGEPEVVIQVSTATQTIGFLQRLQEIPKSQWPKIAITSVCRTSAVGQGVFTDRIESHNMTFEDSTLGQIYQTAVMPDVNDTSLQIIRDFKDSTCSDDYKTNALTFEAYLIGRVATTVLSTFSTEEMNEITAQQYLNRFYELQTIDFYDGEMVVGPLVHSLNYSKKINVTTSDGVLITNDGCNTGLRKVWLTNIREDISNNYFDGMEYSACRPDFTSLLTPAFFGYSDDISSDPKREDISKGFKAAVEVKKSEINALSKNIILLQRDSGGEISEEQKHINEMESKRTFALIALSELREGVETYDLPIIGMARPEMSTMEDPNIINLQSFLYDEVRFCLSYFETSERFAVLIVDDKQSIEEISEDFKELKIIRVDELREDRTYFERVAADIELHYGVNSRTELLLFATVSSVSQKILMSLSSDFYLYDDSVEIAFLGLNDYYDLDDRIGPYFVKVSSENKPFYYTSNFNKQQRLYSEFVTSTEEGVTDEDNVVYYKDFGYYGFLIGRLVSENYIRYKSTSSEDSFVDNFYLQENFNIDHDVVIGPFERDKCNLGMREIFLYSSSHPIENILYSEEFDDCTRFIINKYPLYNTLIIAYSIVIVICICCYICFALLILYVFTLIRRKNKIQPAFEGNCIVGFTDIQNSSELWKVDSKIMKQALKVHNRILRESFRKFGGVEVKFQGDSFLVLWSTVEDAVRNCMDIQQQLLRGRWPKELARYRDARTQKSKLTGKILFHGLRVRIALNYCETINPVFDKNKKCYDYVADEINMCSRIESISLGGQTCSTKQLIDMFLPNLSPSDFGKIGVRRFGRFSFKGTGDADIWEIYPMNLEERVGKYDKSVRPFETKGILLGSNTTSSGSDPSFSAPNNDPMSSSDSSMEYSNSSSSLRMSDTDLTKQFPNNRGKSGDFQFTSGDFRRVQSNEFHRVPSNEFLRSQSSEFRRCNTNSSDDINDMYVKYYSEKKRVNNNNVINRDFEIVEDFVKKGYSDDDDDDNNNNDDDDDDDDDGIEIIHVD